MQKFIAATLILILPVGLQAQAMLYATSGSGSRSSLYVVDPLTAQGTLIGPILVSGSGVSVTALGFHPQTGVLYGVSGSEYTPSRQLFIIDPLTAATTVVGTIGTTNTENASDISFAADGSLYGWSTRGGPFISINVANAGRTVIGTVKNGDHGNGLTFTPDGTLYLAGPSAPGSLYTVDLATGSLTEVAPLSNVPIDFGNINAMTSDHNGVLYATGKSSVAPLVTIDRQTGVMTTIGAFSFGEAGALAFTAVPEPSTWVSLALGCAFVALVIRRKIRR